MVRKILIIEDDELLRRLMAESFTFHHFDALEAGTGALGIQLAAHKPDLILCDIRLPDFSGLEVVSRLQQNPETADIPLILVTGWDVDFSQEITIDTSQIRVIRKPFSVAELINTVKKFPSRVESIGSPEPNLNSLHDTPHFRDSGSF